MYICTYVYMCTALVFSVADAINNMRERGQDEPALRL